MSAVDFEYAIKKDVRNNLIVREVDDERQRQVWRSLAIGGFLVVVILFSAWQHFELLRHGYKIQKMQQRAGGAGGNQPPPAPGDRDAARARTHRGAGERAAPRRAVERGGHRDPAGDALGAA